MNEELTLIFTYSTNILVRLLTVNMKNCLDMCDPILVTLLKMRPHFRQSSRENATPSSGTSPLASYKHVPPPPHPLGKKGSKNETRPKYCKADQNINNLYCFFITIFRLAIPAFFRFTDVTEFMKGITIVSWRMP